MASWLSNLPCPDERYLHSNMHGLWPHTHLLRKFPDTFFEIFWPHTSHPNVHRFHQPHVSPVSRFSPKHIQAQRLSNSFLVQPKERYLISFIYSNVDRLWPYASAQNTVTTRGFYSPITLGRALGTCLPLHSHIIFLKREPHTMQLCTQHLLTVQHFAGLPQLISQRRQPLQTTCPQTLVHEHHRYQPTSNNRQTTPSHP